MPPTRVSSVRLDALVQRAREPVFLLGPDRRILLVNRAWEELTGHRSDEVAGLECHPHGPTRAGDLDGLGASFCPPPEAMNGQPSGTKSLILHADGERRWSRLEFWPFHDAEGALSGADRAGPALRDLRRRSPTPRPIVSASNSSSFASACKPATASTR